MTMESRKTGLSTRDLLLVSDTEVGMMCDVVLEGEFCCVGEEKASQLQKRISLNNLNFSTFTYFCTYAKLYLGCDSSPDQLTLIAPPPASSPLNAISTCIRVQRCVRCSRVAAIAQLGERATEDRTVPGSIPGGGIPFFLQFLLF